MDFSHTSVLLEETIEGLAIRPDGIYVDGTLGRGGHSEEIAKRLTAGGQLHVCVVLHDLNLAALWADRILLLHQGHLVAQGTPQEVIQQPVIHRWYGADVRLVQHPDNAVPQVYLAP